MRDGLKVGMRVKAGKDDFMILDIKMELQDIVLLGKGGAVHTVDFNEFRNNLASGQYVIDGMAAAQKRQTWTDSEEKEAQFRQSVVKLVTSESYNKSSESEQEKMLDTLGDKHNKKVPSLKTIKSYQKKYEKGGFESLIPDYSSRGGSGWKSKRHQKEVATKFILDTYTKNDRLNITTTALLVNAHLASKRDDTGEPEEISASTVSRIIHDLPDSVALSGRLDPRTYRLLKRNAVQEFNVEHAFELMQVDAKTIDMYVRDENGVLYSQITLYAMICSRTSYPVGILVTPGAPSEYTLLQLFEFFFTPKGDDFKARFDIDTDWPAPCGLNKVLLDNAAENVGAVVLDIVRDLGIDIHYARAYRGDDKPHVESFFNVLEQRLFKLMPGAKKSSEKHFKNRFEKAEREACLTVEDVYRAVIQFVTDVYVREPREKLGFQYHKPTSIHEAMQEELKRFMPPPPPSLKNVQRLILNKHKERRTVQHYGIDFSGFQYNSYVFKSMVNQLSPREVEMLYNPSDCTAVYVVHPHTNELIKLDCKIKDLPVIPFETAREVRKLYSGSSKEMTGYDYKKAYTSLISGVINKKPRRPKVKDNNQAARKREQELHHENVKAQLESRYSPEKKIAYSLNDDADDDFTPAPRGKK